MFVKRNDDISYRKYFPRLYVLEININMFSIVYQTTKKQSSNCW